MHPFSLCIGGSKRVLRSRMLIPYHPKTSNEIYSKSHSLLLRAGYISPSVSAGIYRLLPLTTRVLEKLERLVDHYFQAEPLAAEKLRLPILLKADLWKKSGRWDVYGDELVKLADRKGTEYCLAPTHEEEISELVASTGRLSLSQMPLKLYQTGLKYRDEIRPRYGLLRAREFLMTDMYSFHPDEDCARKTYDNVLAAYHKILNTLEVDFAPVQADSGAMGGNYTHEFQILADIGEDQVLYCDTGNFVANAEVFTTVPSKCPDSSCSCAGTGSVISRAGIEVGQTFLLGQRYSEVFNARCELSSKLSPMYMGCYGIGLTRLLASIIESSPFKDRIVWPKVVAPYHVVVITGPGNQRDRQAYQTQVDEFVNLLHTAESRVEVVIDDRWAKGFGSKLNEAILVGYPHVVVIGKKSMSSKQVELIDKNGQSSFLSHGEAVKQICE